MSDWKTSFGLNKLNGRLVWVTSIIVASLFAMTLYAQWMVVHSSADGVEMTRDNNQLTQSVNEIKDSLQEIESQVYQYASLLDPGLNDQLHINLASIKNRVDKLISHHAIEKDTASKNFAVDLKKEIKHLEKNIEDFLLVMRNVESRYPGMPILMDFMEPTNRQFSEAVELALQEGTMTDINPTAVEADLYQVMQLLQEVRFAWSQQISWFRVFVANRMGAFGDPKASMKRNLVNRGLFA
ncbi:MAG: hypothetical protein OEY00_13450, partial [Gammaproteobacteria bacterium]|nr:hypothetical protein [Gammaproteobacteria bacterium]